MCFNPRLKEERARRREELLLSTDARGYSKGVRRKGSLRGKDRINRRVGREANRRKVEKHLRVTDNDIVWSRNLRGGARLDGIRWSPGAEDYWRTSGISFNPHPYVYSENMFGVMFCCACLPITLSAGRWRIRNDREGAPEESSGKSDPTASGFCVQVSGRWPR